jgi:PAS domain S-box-containing protein
MIWSTIAACSLVLAFMYAIVWSMDRKAWASLAFAIDALSLVGTVVAELHMMASDSPQSWGEWVRWIQIPIFLRATCGVVFIRLYLGTGRPSLMWTIIGMRFFIMVVGFTVDPNFNYARIDSISHIPFLGEQVTVVGDAQARNLQWIATLELSLMQIYVADAAIQLWRRGSRDDRRKALIIGGAAFASNGMEALYSQLMILMGLQLPALLSPPNLLMLAAMATEMSRDILRASRLARELKASEARLDVAASAAGLGLWTWNAREGRLWATQRARSMLGLELSDDYVTLDSVRRVVHVDDIERIRGVWQHAAAAGTEEEVQFRVLLPDGLTRWFTARGRSEADARGNLIAVQGVLRDITEERRGREENEELRRELAHVGRVSVLGTLSSSLAHELSQPLGAIQLNTEAAALLLQKPNPDLAEIGQILADIQRDDRRAAEVIEGLRKLLKRRQLDFGPVAVDSLVLDVVSLLKTDSIARNVRLEVSVDPALPTIRGDRVHLSQVLINLLMNAMDAVADLPVSQRQVTLRAGFDESGAIEFTVSDTGPGIPREILARIFDPFYTTKASGMGMGLSVSRTIVDAHGGRLWAENGADGGAVFHVSLSSFVDISSGRIVPPN